ncbi:hypothetical protein GCM10023208_30930 [Erythrobacter westpacificensis]|uniref:Uncharacterized protein n=1 Tax=Erythrobacter westpacificensis TaxID=1055231 RepID=A0ABP9KMF5_9SPHN|tara:strand:- start:95 stop:685 length:591 start_codon:yes stop_codon:yes gene_type:complete
MSKMLRFVLVFLASCCGVVATAAMAQGEIANAPDPFVHSRAGVEFPLALDGFTRQRVYQFDDRGEDISIGYRESGFPTPITVTIYVYPRSGSCSDSFASTVEPIMEYKGAKDLGADIDTQWSKAFAGQEQYFARFLVPAGSYGHDHPDLTSVAWVACPRNTSWVVKLRASYENEAAEPILRPLVDQIDWSMLLGRQ